MVEYNFEREGLIEFFNLDDIGQCCYFNHCLWIYKNIINFPFENIKKANNSSVFLVSSHKQNVILSNLVSC